MPYPAPEAVAEALAAVEGRKLCQHRRGSQASNPKIPQQTEQPEQQGAGIFRDLSQAEWARTYIDSLCADGIVQGQGGRPFPAP